MKSLNNYILEKLKLSKDSTSKGEFVDLGLPSGTLWSKYNLGVEHDELDKQQGVYELKHNWYGGYYSWGETEPKKSGDKATHTNYKFYRGKDGNPDDITKYNNEDGLKSLELEDDAANVENKHYMIPSSNDFDELFKHTEHSVSEYNYSGVKMLSGMIFKSKVNDNEIFIPFTAYFDNSGGRLYEGYYWTSDCKDAQIARAWKIRDNANPIIVNVSKWSAFTIRYIKKK